MQPAARAGVSLQDCYFARPSPGTSILLGHRHPSTRALLACRLSTRSDASLSLLRERFLLSYLGKFRDTVLARAVRLRGERALAALRRRVQAVGLGTRLGLLAALQGVDDLDNGFGREVLLWSAKITYVVVVVDLDHGRIRTGTEALDLDNGKFLARVRLARVHTEALLDRAEHRVGAAATELARRGGAHLDKVLADRRTTLAKHTYRLNIV